MQHFNSFTPDRLSELLTSHGFHVTFCKGIDLERMRTDQLTFKNQIRQGNLSKALDVLSVRWLADMNRDSAIRRFLINRLLTPGPHLVALAER
jgi:hypothetical protein